MKVAISGITGRTGRALAQGLQKYHTVVGGVAKNSHLSLKEISPDLPDVPVYPDIREMCLKLAPEVVVDFTTARAVQENVPVVLDFAIPLIVGTTGVAESFWEEMGKKAQEKGVGILVCSNFSLGANLMIKWSKEAGKYFPAAEILEMHHSAKKDAPSGTALTTARMIGEERELRYPVESEEKIPGVRGGKVSGVPIHSLRLPAAVAHQSVIFSNEGEFLTIRHDALSRSAYLYGVLLALEKIPSIRGVHFGILDFFT
ncbi:MAG: 4-hydroxy-tetrahydrodipicolinate reductase [bacterium JZ-2024 1]